MFKLIVLYFANRAVGKLQSHAFFGMRTNSPTASASAARLIRRDEQSGAKNIPKRPIDILYTTTVVSTTT